MAGPDFIIFGAGKSGTTSLHRYLSQHPSIFMSRTKEPRFFCLDENGHYPDLGPGAPQQLIEDLERSSIPDWDRYCALFDDASPKQKKGEATPLYLATERASIRIRQYLPDVALIAVLRHPVELAFSAFKMTVRNGYESEANFERAVPLSGNISHGGWRWNLYIEQAMHGKNLLRYFARFPRERMKVFIFEDFQVDPCAVVNEICRHIGVNDDLRIDYSERSNVGYDPRFSAEFRAIARRLLPGSLLDSLRSGFTGLARKKIAIPRQVREKYLPVFRDDILTLQDLLDRDLSGWL